jgi:hypothetical protein
MKLKRTMLLCMILAVGVLTGCTLFTGDVGTLTLSAPEFGYPPFEATLTAGGVVGGQYTFDVGGETRTGGNTLKVVIHELPCEVTVTWEGDGIPQTVTKTIYLKNTGLVIGCPVLNAIVDLWTIHPRVRYTVTFPDTYDREGGPVTLVDVTVYNTGQQRENTVFCPPYTGACPPKPELYRVSTGQGDIENAFVFYSIWKGPIEGNSGLPYSPPSQQEAGYPGAPALCGPVWPRDDVPSGMTIITPTFEDEMGARTTESWEIPTMYYPGC